MRVSARARRTWARGSSAIRRCAAARRVGPRLSIPRGGKRADLVVGAAAAGAPRGRGVEAARANTGRGRLDGVDRLLEVGDSRCVTAHDVGVDEAQLQALG